MTNPLRMVSARAPHALREAKWGPLIALVCATLISASVSRASYADGSQIIFEPVPASEYQPPAQTRTVHQEPAELSPWPAAQLAIVIDDLGYDRRKGLAAIALPGRITVAVMPHTPNARYLAEKAHDAGREIILHHPMQGSDFRHVSKSPKGILTLDMGPEDIRSALRQALTSVPHCIGINNHTGSALTGARDHMYWLMQQVSTTDLYYLDSRTTTRTVAGEAAQAWGVPFVSRDVFLDHHNDAESIAREFKRAVNLAKRRGHAVLIAHPRPLSLALLAEQIPQLDPNEIELVHASELIGARNRMNPGRSAAGQ